MKIMTSLELGIPTEELETLLVSSEYDAKYACNLLVDETGDLIGLQVSNSTFISSSTFRADLRLSTTKVTLQDIDDCSELLVYRSHISNTVPVSVFVNSDWYNTSPFPNLIQCIPAVRQIFLDYD